MTGQGHRPGFQGVLWKHTEVTKPSRSYQGDPEVQFLRQGEQAGAMIRQGFILRLVNTAQSPFKLFSPQLDRTVQHTEAGIIIISK